MKILDVLKSKFTTSLKNNEQNVNEKLIELVTFFYKIDQRISLEEQKFVDEFLNNIEWKSSISIAAYHRDCIATVNAIMAKTETEITAYLSDLMSDISKLNATELAKSLAQEISDADGEIADDEVKYIDVIQSF